MNSLGLLEYSSVLQKASVLKGWLTIYYQSVAPKMWLASSGCGASYSSLPRDILYLLSKTKGGGGRKQFLSSARESHGFCSPKCNFFKELLSVVPLTLGGPRKCFPQGVFHPNISLLALCSRDSRAQQVLPPCTALEGFSYRNLGLFWILIPFSPKQ